MDNKKKRGWIRWKKIFLIVQFLIFLLIIISCTTPLTKDAYFDKYESFIGQIKEDCKSYDKSAWQEADKKFDTFNNEWYEKFEDELTVSDKATILKYQAKYKYFRFEADFSHSWDKLLEEDIEDIKEKIEYYVENDMEEDIKELWEKAEKAGKEAIEKLKEIFEELELEWEQYNKPKEDAPDQI